MKPTILYIIDSLERGGAEIMMVSPLKEIYSRYNVIIVTLGPGDAFSKEELYFDHRYCLDITSKWKMISAAGRLKTIIKTHDVQIVHSFLYWSGIVARMACGKRVPYVCSLATVMSSGVYHLKWYSGYTLLLDRYTYRKSHYIISPTEEVLQDYLRSSGAKGRTRVIPNFVNEKFFGHKKNLAISRHEIKLVAVGNLKNVKNYQLMIEAFKLLINDPVSLDIYGEGPERESLQKQIDQFGLAIKLKGSNSKIYEVLCHYDAYVMCSYIEGFGISAAEAMATGLPLLLTDLKVLKEVSHRNALFFDPFDATRFVQIVKNLLSDGSNLTELATRAAGVAEKFYTKEFYLDELFTVYDEVFPGLSKNKMIVA